jgi:hypothetical protein
MNERAEKFRQELQKELGLTVGPKDPILAEWLAHEEFREELAAEHTLAPAQRRGTRRQSRYRRQIRRWRRTNPTGRLTSHFNKDAPVSDTQLLTISHLKSRSHQRRPTRL